ncbi:hypothetical protein KQ51_00347 [Candidatus Izimaplasma bacterium HR1]|jgi:uncharacterized beta-barrel protein YwiB (DUF1934 family)|uniref:DUF1934 family protein n=1 Tax=Candidatus Izimoplasma sp. HR1 TaxID=1541959 RepID=UPI0004F84495|nr:hypothetical protein KQ51_00347 [Candidatus Izimaplasma bacterium HR1]
MKKIRVDFQIKSLDTDNSFVINGEYSNNRIKFIDNEKNINYIIFHEDNIQYYKKGNIDMKFKFDMQHTTKGEYTSSGYEFVFEIKTNRIVRKDGHLYIQYDLYQDKELVNETEIILEYTCLKEELL